MRRPSLRFAVLVVVGWLVVPSAVGAAAGQPAVRDPASHLAALEHARELASEGLDDPSPARMDAVREAVGRPVSLDLAGVVVDLPDDRVLSRLDGSDRQDFETARARIALLAAGLRSATEADPPDPTALAAALADAYREVDARPTLMQRVWRVAEDLVIRLAEAIAGADTGVSIAALVALGLLTAGALWMVAKRLLVVADEHAPAERPRPSRSADWRREADAALAAGDLDRAVRAQYRLLIHELSRRGLVRDTPSLTPAEARRAVTRAPVTVGEAVGTATGIFERMAYGEVLPHPHDVERMRSAVEAAAP